jgi:hypothetical protein
MNPRLSTLMDELIDSKNQITGFSLENTVNGFIISLIILREDPQALTTIKMTPIYCYEEGISYEDVVDPIISAMKMRK